MHHSRFCYSLIYHNLFYLCGCDGFVEVYMELSFSRVPFPATSTNQSCKLLQAVSTNPLYSYKHFWPIQQAVA